MSRITFETIIPEFNSFLSEKKKLFWHDDIPYIYKTGSYFHGINFFLTGLNSNNSFDNRWLDENDLHYCQLSLKEPGLESQNILKWENSSSIINKVTSVAVFNFFELEFPPLTSNVSLEELDAKSFLERLSIPYCIDVNAKDNYYSNLKQAIVLSKNDINSCLYSLCLLSFQKLEEKNKTRLKTLPKIFYDLCLDIATYKLAFDHKLYLDLSRRSKLLVLNLLNEPLENSCYNQKALLICSYCADLIVQSCNLSFFDQRFNKLGEFINQKELFEIFKKKEQPFISQILEAAENAYILSMSEEDTDYSIRYLHYYFNEDKNGLEFFVCHSTNEEFHGILVSEYEEKKCVLPKSSIKELKFDFAFNQSQQPI